MDRLNLYKRYFNLGNKFHTEVKPTPLKDSVRWVHINNILVHQLGLINFKSNNWLNIMSGAELAEGYTPISSLYAGHQFGGWAPQL